MAAFPQKLVCLRTHRAIVASLALLFASCHHEDVEHARAVESLKTDLEEAKRRLGHVHKSLAAKDEELNRALINLESTKSMLSEKEHGLAERESQLRTAKAEIEVLKKRDAFVFAEIRALQQQGQTAAALKGYQKFMKDFPKSPLFGTAASAIAEMAVSPSVARTAPPAATPDPKRREREVMKNFNEGYATLQELAPVMKKKSLSEVLALLGKPNQTFNEGTEIGYSERAINPATGSRGMLVIGFENGTVASLRVEYGGRKMTP